MANIDSLVRAGREDWELLRAFFEEGSEDAFRELVGRHVKGVYSHARRVLGDRHLAEDVTQAVFLLLAQKGGRISEQVVLVGWLYKVTQFACANAKRVEARRVRHERKAALMKEVASEEAGLSEEEVHVDRIVGGLPTRERDALLMKYVEGRTVMEIGRAMGCSAAAAEKRVQRALEKVRGRFAAIGIESPAGMKAVEVLGAGMVPTALLGMSVRGALSGTASPAVVHLVKGTAMMMFAAKAKMVAAVLVAVLTVGVGGILLAQKGAAPEIVQAAIPAPVAVVPVVASTLPVARLNDASDLITVRGTVFDPNGKPVAGAEVAVPGPFSWVKQFSGHAVARATSGTDGRFEIAFRKGDVSIFNDGEGNSGAEDWKKECVLASAEGFGLAWKEWDHTNAAGELELRLVADMPIEGRIVDAKGNGIRGTHVMVERVEAGDTDAVYKKMEESPELAPDLEVRMPLEGMGMTDEVTTDEGGRFTLKGMGRDRNVGLHIHGGGAAYERIQVVTRMTETTMRTVGEPAGVDTVYTTYGAHFTMTATPSVLVEGTVRDAADGHAMAGVLVESDRFAGRFQGIDTRGLLRCITDKDGHYWLEGFPAGKGNSVMAEPDDTQCYFIQEAAVEEGDPVTLDFNLHKGVWITGKVTDKVTGEPVAARISYTTYTNNEHTLDLPEFVVPAADMGTMQGYQLKYETKADGSYRVVAVPGTGIVSAESFDGQYRTGVGSDQVEAFQDRRHYGAGLFGPFTPPNFANVIMEVEVPAKAESVTADLQLDPGMTVRVNIVDAEGKAVPGCWVRGERAHWAGRAISGASFDAIALSSGEKREVVARNDARQIGRVFILDTNEVKGGVVTLRLEPLAEVSGRCLDVDGKPAAGLFLEVWHGMYTNEITTDAGGRFRVPVMTGYAFGISVFGGKYVGSKVVENILFEPGEKKDVGNVRLEVRPPG